MNIDSIPIKMLDKLNEIKDIKLIIQNNIYLFDTNKEIINNLNKISILIEISSIFKMIYIKEYFYLSKKGLKIIYILLKDIMFRIKNEFEDIYNEYKKMKNVTFFIINDINIASFTITNYFISFSLFTKNGYYINHEMISYNHSSIIWGRRLFNYYKKISYVL